MQAETTANQAECAYDLFISYAAADRTWVEGYLLDALNAAGVRCHSEAAFALGVPRLLEFERAVRGSQRILLVLSPAYLAEGFSQFTDLLAQSYGLETATWPVIPLILQAVELPPRLAMLTALDATDPATWPQVVERLCAELQRPLPGPAPKPPCPYPGMVPFCADDARFFYGREEEIEELRRRLRHQRYLWIIGPSGSGKSSLVFAGLVPKLHERQPDHWQVRTMRPGHDPVAALQTAIADLIPLPISNLHSPSSILQPPTPNLQLLLIVDQCEELFTQASKEEQATFIAAIRDLRTVESCTLLLTLRADFYPELITSDLWPVQPAERVEIAPLRGDALRDAIALPAERQGVYLEVGLLERLLADAAEEPGVLPLVQETMMLLWERMTRRLLPLSAYERLGGAGRSGLAVAVATRAGAALAELSSDQQAIARRVFVRLVQFGEGRADTRRQQPVAALRAAGDDPETFGRTLEHLARSRLLTLSGEERGDGRRVDIAHEALIAGWPALRGWLAQRREAEQTRRRLEAKAAEWVWLGRGVGGLLDEIELAEARRWLDSADAQDLGYDEALPALVKASHEAIQREKEEKEADRRRELALERQARRQLQVIVAALGLLVLLGIGWLARLELLRLRAQAAGELRPVPGLNVAFERYEVTNGRYALCVQAGRCSAPPAQLSTYFRERSADLPVTGVDALQAAAFCRWIGRRLPTHAEWLYAATQGGRAAWPWGEEEPTAERTNLLYEPDTPVALPPQSWPLPVGGREGGATPEGIHDLLGNVWEWTATPWEKPGREGAAWDGDPATAPGELITEGGSYLTSLSGLGTEADPVYAGVSFRTSDVGFRCVKGDASHVRDQE